MKQRKLVVILLSACALLIVVAQSMRPSFGPIFPNRRPPRSLSTHFADWAFLYLTASYRDYSSETHFVSIARETISGRVRFKVTGSYTKTAAGQAWFDGIGLKIRKGIEGDCKRWTAEGFPISLNDFQIDITQAKQNP